MHFSRDDQRRIIVMKAMETVKNGTYDNLSIRKFCAEAGITTGAFYRCFPSREALFFQCYVALLEETLDKIGVLLSGLPYEEQLVRFSLLLIKISIETGEQRINQLRNDPSVRSYYKQCHEIAAKKLCDILLSASSDGRIRREDIPFVMDAFFAVLQGVCSVSTGSAEEWTWERREKLLHSLMPAVLTLKP